MFTYEILFLIGKVFWKLKEGFLLTQVSLMLCLSFSAVAYTFHLIYFFPFLYFYLLCPPRLSILFVPSFFLVRHACSHTHTHARTHTHIILLLPFYSSLNTALSFQPSLYPLLDLCLCKIHYTRGIEKFSALPTSQNPIQWPNIKFLVEGPLSQIEYIFTPPF